MLYGIAGLFALLSVHAYLTSTRALAPGARWRWLSATWLLCAGSVFTYPISLGIAGVFVLIDLAEAGSGYRAVVSRRWLVIEKLVLAVPGIVGAVVAWRAEKTAPAHWRASGGEFGAPLLDRAQQAIDAAFYYLWRPWWPVDLTPAPTWLIDLEARRGVSLAAGLLLLGVTLVLGRWRRGRNGAALAWVAHFLLLAPMLGWAARPHFANDRYHYLAAVALCAALAWGLSGARPRWRPVLAGAMILVVVIAGSLQRQQLGIWRNTDSLMKRIVTEAEDASFRGHTYWRWTQFHLGHGDASSAEAVVAAARADRVPAVAVQSEAALAEYVTAASAEPALVPLAVAKHHRMAADFTRAGRMREADEHFRAAMRITPVSAAGALNYAVYLALAGRAGDALHIFMRHVADVPADQVSGSARARFLALLIDSEFGTSRPKLARRLAEIGELVGDGDGGNAPAGVVH